MGDGPSQSQLAEVFMSSFNSKKKELRTLIDTFSCESPDISEKLTDVLTEIQKLSKSLHDAALYLPSYSVKMRQNEIRELEKALKEKEDELLPKKKFGFKSKPKTATSSAIKVDPEDDSTTHTNPSLDAELKMHIDSNFVTIENLEDTVYVCDHDKLSGTDVLVRNLTNVVLHLYGSPSTLRISNVKYCKILCGPVHTSIFVDSAIDCELFLCCQQLRTHSSKNSDIYLRVRSRAIIEECTGIRFAPYHWNHPRSVELHEAAQISADLERYDAVDDFNWLSASQSPNWSILPEEERHNFPSL